MSAAMVLLVPIVVNAATASAAPRLYEAASTGPNSERVKTMAIERQKKKSRKVVFSIKPKQLPDPERGSVLEATGEVTLTTTCVDNSARCIGSKYGYSPKLGMRIVLTGKEGATGGRRVTNVSRRVKLKCRQDRPNRNHHCPLVIENSDLKIGALNKLPCKPSKCRLNMVVDATSKRARPENVVVVGADRPDGSIDQSKGRLNAVLFRQGAKPGKTRRTTRIINDRLPMGSEGSGGAAVVFSIKIKRLDRGDVIIARAHQFTAIGHLPYSAFVSGELIVGRSRNSAMPRGIAKRAISYRGTLSEVNGFNCTQGPSAFSTPCLTKKVGLGRVQRDVVNKKGKRVPLFVNLVSRTFPKLANAGGDHSAAVGGGFIEVRRLSR